VHLVIRIAAGGRDEAHRHAALGMQRLHFRLRVERRQRGRRAQPLQPRPQRVVDRVG
jgi:hypothetical protein